MPLPPFEHYFADPEQYYINSTDCGPQTPMQITPQFSFQIPCNITAAVCDSVKLDVSYFLCKLYSGCSIDGDVVLLRGLCGTFKRGVWYFEEVVW